jgi:hypothetical protein
VFVCCLQEDCGLVVDFASFPALLLKLLNLLVEQPTTYLGLLVLRADNNNQSLRADGSAVLEFAQNLEFKAMSLLSMRVEAVPQVSLAFWGWEQAASVGCLLEYFALQADACIHCQMTVLQAEVVAALQANRVQHGLQGSLQGSVHTIIHRVACLNCLAFFVTCAAVCIVFPLLPQAMVRGYVTMRHNAVLERCAELEAELFELRSLVSPLTCCRADCNRLYQEVYQLLHTVGGRLQVQVSAWVGNVQHMLVCGKATH